MIPGVLALLAESDCEAIGDGLLRQPVAAVSSLSFVVLGAVLLRAGRGEERRTDRIVFAMLMAATGVGSLLYHGPQGAVAHYLHDVTAAALLGAVLLAVIVGRRPELVPATAAVTLVVAGARASGPGATTTLVGVLVTAGVVARVLLRPRAPLRRPWYTIAAVASVAAGIAFAAGRTGSPLCDPAGLVQGHAAWHVLAAVAVFSFFLATEPARTRMAA